MAKYLPAGYHTLTPSLAFKDARAAITFYKKAFSAQEKYVMPAANVAVQLQLPADRWLLAAFGPAVGPAVLYWGELIVLIALAAIFAPFLAPSGPRDQNLDLLQGHCCPGPSSDHLFGVDPLGRDEFCTNGHYNPGRSAPARHYRNLRSRSRTGFESWRT